MSEIAFKKTPTKTACPTSVAAPRSRSRLATGLALIAMASVLAIASPALAQEAKPTKEAKAPQDPAARKKMMEERREQRQQEAEERREKRNDPEFVKQNVWWNTDATAKDLSLTADQRKKADAALARFLQQRQTTEEASQAAQKAFFEALEAGAADTSKKADAMVNAMAEANRNNAKLRIEVLSLLTKDQRTKLTADHSRLLRSNWTDARGSAPMMKGARRKPGS